jgi:membrane-associated phospholipid phosphatase
MLQFGTAPWSEQAQDEPGPGAWLWAPGRDATLSHATSANLGRFLATQLPAEVLLPSLGLAYLQADLPPVAAYAPPRSQALTASDWGEIGLLQTPTARMERPGEMRLHVSGAWPYSRLNVMLQPMEWLEVGFRYTDIANQLYGASIAGGQTYKDKSIDLKLQLLDESALRPQVALGLRDIGGTGLFSGEYLVANKRWGNWDASAGLGWGYLGGRGNVAAPFGFLGDSFKDRPRPEVGEGGTVNSGGMFRGNAALFGGVQWQTPLSALILKAELDGNDYRNEPFGVSLSAPSPLNLGAVYRYSPHVDVTAAWQRGDRFTLGLTLHAAAPSLEAPKVLDPVLPRVQPLQTGNSATVNSASVNSAPVPLPPAAWSNAAQSLGTYTGWQVTELEQNFSTLTVRAESDDSLFVQERLQRAITVLHAQAPSDIRHFVFALQQRGVALATIEVDRAEWVAKRTRAQAPELMLPAEKLYPGRAKTGMGNTGNFGSTAAEAPVYRKPTDTGLNIEWGPSYSQILGGPDGFLLFEAGVQAKLEQRFAPSTWLSANLNARLLDNYAGFKYDAPSDLPRVRTYAREYVITSRATMPVLQLTHVMDLGAGHYASVYGGMLESMYAGVGGEWLYRPWQGKLAFGVDVNRVRQRDFAQNFALRDYEVSTGHATAYWDTGWKDVQVKLSAGQYLAADTGATLDVKRMFANGTAIGAWATKTNVSAQQFGEGSFDKGIYLHIPLDVMLPKSAPGVANVVWNPLTRDGGARLNRSVGLFDLTRQRDARIWGLSSTPLSDAVRRVSGEDRTAIEPQPSQDFWQYTGASATALGRGIAGVPGTTWAWGAAAVLGASVLDSEVDQWARNHQSAGWERAGKLANGVPYALALGTGLLFTGIAGEDAAHAAQSSLTAAAYTLGGNLLTKYAVGRARPADELGSSSFNGFTSSAAQSSFGSNHVALAFALATPFAQQYDNPWLYGLAGSTALGRIQNREHWLSDTVAGGLMGYAIGSMTFQQRNGKAGVRLTATPQSVNAHWSF